MAIKIKICGITNPDDAILSAKLGADALGFIFYKKSPRYISPVDAKAIIKRLPPFVSSVGIFVNESRDSVIEIATECSLTAVQLSGDETRDFFMSLPFQVIKAVRVKDASSLGVIRSYDPGATILLDSFVPGTYGGTGTSFDWQLVGGYLNDYHIIMAGGLRPENVSDMLRELRPYGIDVSSGVEQSPGKKDPEKLRSFVRNVKKAEFYKD